MTEHMSETDLARFEEMRRIDQQAHEVAEKYPKNVRGFVRHLIAESGLIAATHGENSPYRSFKYQTYIDLIHDLGRRPRRAVLQPPPGAQEVEVGECYYNCWAYTLNNPEYTYVEGYAQTNIMPVRHAWIEGPDGAIYDPTWSQFLTDKQWKDLGFKSGFRALYWGVRFDSEFLFRRVNETGYTSVFDADWNLDFRTLRLGLVLDDRGRVVAEGES